MASTGKSYTGLERLGVRVVGEVRGYVLATTQTVAEGRELVRTMNDAGLRYELCRVREYVCEEWNRDAGQFGRVWRNDWVQV